MKLIECYIENFGTLEEYRHKFSDGLNCFLSDNGTGKTTLTSFIMAMLYGLADTKKQSLDENDRKKYAPWQGGRYGGTLTLEIKGKKYVIERSFGQKASEDTYKLYDAESGKESLDYTENLGSEVFGIDRDGFTRTVFLSEKNLPVRSGNQTISAKLADLVGVENDVGGYDAAKKLLDEKRKIYYKQSGNCEIARVKTKIREKRELEYALEITEKSLEYKENVLTEKNKELNAAKAQKAALTEKQLENARKKENRLREEQYVEILKSVEKGEEELRSLRAFFGAEIPRIQDIEKMRFALEEGERIKKEEAKEIGGEYLLLSEIYGEGIDLNILSDVESAHNKSRELESEISAIKCESDEVSVQMRDLFPDYIPTKEEVKAAIDGLKSKRKKAPVLLTILGILSIFAGVVLGNAIAPFMYAFTAFGAVLFITGTLMFSKSKSSGNKEAAKLIKILQRPVGVSPEVTLHRINMDLELYCALKQKREDRLIGISEKNNAITKMLKDFTESFDIQRTGIIEEDLKLIREGYSKFYKLRLENEGSADGRQIRLNTAEEKIKEAHEFLDRFDTQGADPFTEITDKLGRYTLVLHTVQKEKDACLQMKERYGLTGVLPEGIPENDISEDELALIEEKISTLTRDVGVLTDEYNRTLKDVEQIDSIRAEIIELEDTLKRYNEIHETIQKTSALLTEAYDNMNSRYIGKTKESFLRYEEAIGGDGGDYTVRYDFEVQKSENGAIHSEQSYSRGTRDLISLAMRLSIVDSLFENESPFIILDDPFIALDDTKIKRGRALLSELSKSRQVLYFTCSSSRKV